MILEAIITTGKIKAGQIAGGIVIDWIKAKGADFLGLEKNDFTKELENVVYATIDDFDKLFPIPEEAEKIPFYKSDLLIQTLLSIKFIGRDKIDAAEIKSILSANSNIIPPSQTAIFRFLDLFENKCKENPKLRQNQFNNNYKEAIFAVLEIVDSINSTFNRVLSEMNTSLKGEYFAQLEEIEENIKAFKPKTALERIEGIEKRIKQNSQLTPQIESKLLFLKGNCLLESERNLDGPQLIIRAYLLNNDSIKSEAALAYLNLKEKDKATELATEIIEKNPYDVIAWLVLIILGKEDYEQILSRVPSPVKDKRGFAASVIQHLKFNLKVLPNTIESLGLRLPNVYDDKITHVNKTLWDLVAGIKLSEYFEVTKEYRFNNGKVQYSDTNALAELLPLLNKIFEAIKNTEVSDNYPHLKFYFFFVRHILGDDKFDKDEFKSVYLKLKDFEFNYALHFAEYLANTGDIQGAVDIIEQSKFKSEELLSFHLIYYKRVLGHDGEVRQLTKAHIDSIKDIDFSDIHNIITFLEIFLPDNERIRLEYQKILTTKAFQSDAIKSLFEIAVEVTYFKNETGDKQIPSKLWILKDQFTGQKNVIFYIAQLLFQLEAYKDCAELLNPLTERGLQTPANSFYCQSLYESNSNLPLLLKFLEEIRVKNENNQYGFLALETNLRLNLSDPDGIIDISWRGVRQFPDAEFFHVNLVSALERKGLLEELQDYVQKHFKPHFKNENNGVWVSHIVSRNGFVKEAAILLYNLASKPTNYTARTNYVTNMHWPQGFFIDYEIVEKGSNLKLISKNGEVKLLTVNEKDKYGLAGKRRGDTVMLAEKMGVGLRAFDIARVMNDELFLFETILDESKDSNSELGLESFDFTNSEGKFDAQAFEKQILGRFGIEDEIRQKAKEELLDSYNKGEKSFTEISRQVFNDNFLECYEYLTSQNFFALPTIYNSAIQFSTTETYAIDFTALILFSELQSKYGIPFNRKFVISTNMTAMIKDEIIKLQSYPSPKMKLAIIGGKMVPFFYPDNYNEKQIEKFNTLLAFLNENCTEVVLEEKLEYISGSSERHQRDPYFNCMLDNTLFATNRGYTLISNDTTMIKYFGQSKPKQISPELFLLRYFKGNYQKEMIDYFIDKHYIGVMMNSDVILREYRKKQMGEANAFSICLSNLKYRWTLAPINLSAAIKFLKEIYTSGFGSENEKVLLCQSVFVNLLDGCSRNEKVIAVITAAIYVEFNLLGDSLNKVLDAYETSLGMYGQ
jgi:hypothetical protein